MEKKSFTEVVIDGKIYKLGGYESEEYLHQVASYLNNRITELKALEGYSRLPASLKSLMLDLNTADDYFKAKKSADRLEEELADKDRELYEVRHELVSLQVKQEEAERALESLREENADYQRQAAELQAKLSGSPAAGTLQTPVYDQRASVPAAAEGEIAAAAEEDTDQAAGTGEAAPAAAGETAASSASGTDAAASEEGSRGTASENSRAARIPDEKTREAMIRSARESFQASRRRH